VSVPADLNLGPARAFACRECGQESVPKTLYALGDLVGPRANVPPSIEAVHKALEL
jgi:hypothetical protein